MLIISQYALISKYNLLIFNILEQNKTKRVTFQHFL